MQWGARFKRKGRLGALRCSGPPRDGGRRIGASADLARPSGTLYSSAISPTAVPWRIVRRSSGWSSHGAASLFAAASCPARELPIKASAPTTARAARSEAERAEREAGQMRSCTPTPSAPSATGRQSGKSQKSIACPKARPNRSRHRFAAPLQRGGPLHQSASRRLSLWTVHGPFLFWHDKREMGGASAQPSAWLNPRPMGTVTS